MKILIILAACAAQSFAATGATAVWELRNAGNDTNGGGFDLGIASAGTDMSIFDNKNATACTSCQSTSVNISTTDAVTINTTTVTSATGNFSSALIGNPIYLTGTGTTTGWYWVSAVGGATSVTVDRATGSTGGTGVTMNIGGAIKTFSQAFTNTVAGNIIYAKGSANFSISSGVSWATACTNTSPCQLIGYTTTRTDNGPATLIASVSVTNMFTDTGAWHYIKNILIDGASKTSTTTANVSTGSEIFMSNMTIQNFTVRGLILANSGAAQLTNSLVTGGVSGCTAAITIEGRFLIQYNRITANACHGLNTLTTTGVVAIRNIIDNNTGASTDGINLGIAPSGTTQQIFLQNDIYGNGRHGIFGAVAAAFDNTYLLGNIISKNATDGINSTTTVYPIVPIDYNAFWNNGGDTGTTITHNLVNYPQGAHDACAATCFTTISGDPYVAAGSNNFALNSTSGAGAALRAAGFPGVMPSGGTGYMDFGTLQHQDTGGAGVTVGYPIQ